MLQKVSIKLGLCPDSSLLSDRVLCNRYFQKVVQVSAEEIFSDIFHLIILSYSFIFFKISFFGTKKTPKTKHQKTNTPPSPQNKPQNFSRRSKKSNFSQSFKRDFSDTLSFSIIINQGEGQELLYLFHSYLFPVQGCHVFLDFESTGAFTTKYTSLPTVTFGRMTWSALSKFCSSSSIRLGQGTVTTLMNSDEL